MLNPAGMVEVCLQQQALKALGFAEKEESI